MRAYLRLIDGRNPLMSSQLPAVGLKVRLHMCTLFVKLFASGLRLYCILSAFLVHTACSMLQGAEPVLLEA